MIKRENVVIIGLIGVIILISWASFNSTRALEGRVIQMQGEIVSLRSQISHEVGRVSGIVQQIQEESRWWSPGKTEVLEVGTDTVDVKIDWYLREFQDGSSVTFHYRQTSDGEFTSIEAEKGSEGYYYSILSISMDKEPAWYGSVSRQSSSSLGRHQEEVVEEGIGEGFYDQRMYEYYISVVHDGTTRTSKTMRIDLAKISHSLFNPVFYHVRIYEERPISVNLHQRHVSESRYKIEEVFVESRVGSRVVERWALEKSGAGHPEETMYDAMIQAEKEYDSLYIVVNYNEGVTAERKIK